MSLNNLNNMRKDWNKILNRARTKLNKEIRERALDEIESIREGKINAYNIKEDESK